MHKVLTRLASFPSISSSNSYSVQLPLQGAITDICLVTLGSGAPAAIGTEITGIALKAGDKGQIVQPVTPADLNTLAAYKYADNGYAAVTGVTPIYTAPENANAIQRMAYMIGTANLSSLTVEIDVGTLSAVDACEVWGTRLMGGEFDRMGLGRHARLSKEVISTTGTGEKHFDQMPYVNESGVRLLAVHAKNAAGTGTVLKSKVEINEIAAPFAFQAVREAIQGMHGRTVQSNYFAMDFGLDNGPDVGIPMKGVSRLNVVLDWSVDPAAAHDLLIETIHGLDDRAGI